MNKILLLLLWLGCSAPLLSQTVVQDDLGRNNPALQAPKGTYDVLIDTTKGFHIVEMTRDILIRIEENRALSTYTYLALAPSIQVRIHPRNTLSNSNNLTNQARHEK